MVRIAVEPNTAGMRTLGITLTRTVCINEEVKIIHLTLPIISVARISMALEQGAAHNYLVEEIPRTLVGKRSYTIVEHLPPGIVEAVGFHLLLIAFSPEHLGTRTVLWIIIEVAHDYHTLIGTDGPKRVGYLLAQIGGSLAKILRLLLSAKT